MKPKAADFFAYQVSDIQASIRFYRDTLGLEPIGEYGNDDGLFWAEFECGSSTIALHVVGYGPPTPTVAIAVDDVEATVEELQGNGVEVTWPATETPACWVAGITDPDGNQIVIHRRHDGTCG